MRTSASTSNFHMGRKTLDDGLLSSSDVCRLAGITYRQLDLWTRKGLIEPEIPSPGSGYFRRWHPRVVYQVADLLRRIEACPLDH